MLTDEKYETIEVAFVKLCDALERMRRHAKTVMDYPDPDERESLPDLISTMMDDAHEILDLAHEFKQSMNAQK